MKYLAVYITFFFIACSAKPPSPDETINFIRIKNVPGRSLAGNRSEQILAFIDGGDAESMSFINSLWAKYRNEFAGSDWFNFGPDSGYVEIEICNKGEKLLLRSWHPLFESNPNLIASSHGIETLNGRTSESIRNTGPEQYWRRRDIFDDVYQKCLQFPSQQEQIE